MGKKGKWFGAVRRVFSPESKEKKGQEHKSPSSKKKWGSSKPKDAEDSAAPPPPESSGAFLEVPASPPHPAAEEETKLAEAENEQDDHAYSMALATAVAAEAAVAAAQAAAEVVRLTTATMRFPGKSVEEVAVIRIQTAYRGYLARRALRALRGLVRLKDLVHGNSVKRQATTTLRCMQTLARVQSQIRTRRIRMTEENQALQRHLQLKRERELEALRAAMGENWDDSLQSKEQIEASIVGKHEAAIKRERALAYAYSHQWKSSSRSVNPMFTDLNNPSWGWSWLERWMAAKPWETRSSAEKEPGNDQTSVKSATQSAGEIAKAYARRDSNVDKLSPVAQKLGRPASRHSPASSTPLLKSSPAAVKLKPASPRGEEDARSMVSIQSERNRRHSIAGSSVRDDESLASSPSLPSYMIPTESARAKSRLQSLPNDVNDSFDMASPVSVKKRLSFPSASPARPRRHSGPPKVSITVATNGSSK